MWSGQDWVIKNRGKKFKLHHNKPSTVFCGPRLPHPFKHVWDEVFGWTMTFEGCNLKIQHNSYGNQAEDVGISMLNDKYQEMGRPHISDFPPIPGPFSSPPIPLVNHFTNKGWIVVNPTDGNWCARSSNGLMQFVEAYRRDRFLGPAVEHPFLNVLHGDIGWCIGLPGNKKDVTPRVKDITTHNSHIKLLKDRYKELGSPHIPAFPQPEGRYLDLPSQLQHHYTEDFGWIVVDTENGAWVARSHPNFVEKMSNYYVRISAYQSIHVVHGYFQHTHGIPNPEAQIPQEVVSHDQTNKSMDVVSLFLLYYPAYL